MDAGIHILPVGGLGRIGMNGMLVGHKGRWILVDCGVEWPDVTMAGVERVLPDLRFLEGMADRIEAVVITHGHEDHIGALPWVLPLLGDVPVHASSFTAELIRHRLAEHGVRGGNGAGIQLHRPGESFEAGPFEVEPIRVTHSIPDCSALVMRCQDGTIVHTGDWKIDENPLDGEHFDRAAFERVGRDGVTLLLSDSTNIRSEGRTRGEAEVGNALAARIAGWKGRVVVTQFASNLHRLRSLAGIAEATGRRLVFAGRSLWRYLEAARRDGRAPMDPGQVVKVDKLDRIPPEEALVVTTGTQGERLSALWQASIGRHRHLLIGPGDLVLHSASVIPGNETTAYEMFNHITRRGAELAYGRQTGLHASGHGKRGELAELIGLLKPAHFVPVHGEMTFLQCHGDLARELGVPGVTVIENGEELAFGAGRHHGVLADHARVAQHDLASFYNDGPATGDRGAMALAERQRIAWNGVVMVSAGLTHDGNRYQPGEIRLETRSMWTDEGRLVVALKGAAHGAIVASSDGATLEEVESAIETAVRGTCRARIGKRPEVMVTIHAGHLT